MPEGVYTFKTQLDQQLPLQYSAIDGANVVYQQGQFIDQYTVTFSNEDKEKNATLLEQAIIKLKFSPKLFKELIHFQVELNSIPTGDLVSRDVTVNWKMYGGFDPNDTFYTDSNGLEMQKRVIDHYDRYAFKGRESRIPRNYYPVNGAIAMRDANGSFTQVTIMNDRP